MTAPTRTAVLLCDDHRMFREGARRILEDEPDIVVVGDVASVEDAREAAAAHRPDVVILDISLRGTTSGLDGIALLREACPDARILMVSMHHDRSFVQAAFANGASGYLTKSGAADDLAAAVRLVAAGGDYVPSWLSEPSESSPLTGRERQVLDLLAAGHTNPEISEILHLSTRTVETYRSQLARKLNAGSRAEVIREAKVRGILE
ncbi:MAG TPA: response regulator transcription factor [Pseudonocardia sp.]|nr:response regulator transcription factor [Pseudonocardia sp.]